MDHVGLLVAVVSDDTLAHVLVPTDLLPPLVAVSELLPQVHHALEDRPGRHEARAVVDDECATILILVG